MTETYDVRDKIPLSFVRIKNGVIQTGLTVSVVVRNTRTGAVLLSSTNCPETITGNGIYTYDWQHGLTEETACIAIYTVGTSNYAEYFTIGDIEQDLARAQ